MEGGVRPLSPARVRKRPRTEECLPSTGTFMRNSANERCQLHPLNQHQIAFFGSPGVGKTTAICALSGMEKQEQNELKRKMVLPTGSGRITICEVVVRSAGEYSVIVDPCSIDEVRQYVADFSDQMIRSSRGAALDVAGETAGVSAEIERALRNMSGLRKKTTRTADGKIKREDPALELVAAYPAKEDLHVQILSRMELPRRAQTSVSMPRHSTIKGLDWLERASRRSTTEKPRVFTSAANRGDRSLSNL